MPRILLKGLATNSRCIGKFPDASGTVSRCIGNGLPMHRERPRCYKPRAVGGKMYDFGVLKVMVLFGIHPHAQNTPKGTGDEFPMHREISRCIGNLGGGANRGPKKKIVPKSIFVNSNLSHQSRLIF